MKYLTPFFACIPVSIMAAPQPVTQDLNQLTSRLSTISQVPAPIQEWRDSNFNTRFFSPWDRQIATYSPGLSYFVKWITAQPYYGENKLPIPGDRIQAWVDAMDVANYPSMGRRAMTVANTSLRLAPTERPFFLSFDLPGEGYPFDYAQETGLVANTPIWVTHRSTDGGWFFVETAELAGWISARDIAWMTDAQCQEYKSGRYVAVVKDQVPMLDLDGQNLWTGRVGMIFPVERDVDDWYSVKVILRGADGSAQWTRSVLKKEFGKEKPLPLTPENIAQIGMTMMGQPYGWGDLYGDRDCASMIQDLFVPFGVWLPRNGNDQGLKGGYYITLKSLKPEDKERMIIENGIPFLTLLWLKGHIMVYVGTENGRALAFHNIWGIRTKSQEGKEGRHLIGKSLITTLSPGEGVPFADPNGDLLKRLDGMTILFPKFY